MATEVKKEDSGSIRELVVPAHDGQLGRVRDFIVELAEGAGFSPRETSNVKLAVDEACTNIIKHAYDGHSSGGNITVRGTVVSGNLTISLRDTGRRFDFAGVKDPDLEQYVETGRKGGLGVFLINRLMDGVEYHASPGGNELVLTKNGTGALSSIGIQRRPLRGTLRYKFTMRAGIGLFALVATIGSFLFVRQTSDIESQEAARWLDKRRVVDNVATRAVDVLLRADEFSIEQTTMSTDLTRLVQSDESIEWARVVDANGTITASGNIDEIFSEYVTPAGDILVDDGRIVWTRVNHEGQSIRDVAVGVHVSNPETGQTVRLGTVYFGFSERAALADVEDNRFETISVLLLIFVVGLVLIMGLVKVFVKPIQVLTDGVRAIGDGTFDSRLEVDGPAEIGAIASVFNEMTDKFKKAQDSILEQEKMHKEMEVAKEIQHSLLPRHRPQVSGYDIAPLYQAAAEVGGDYYDFVQVDDDTIGVVVADVSGKGVPGSMVMTMIRTALRMEARGNKNASDVMSKMNAFVTDDMKKGMFVTMFYVILDSKNRIISYASAGHNPMILYRHETRETFFLNPKGFPVGISLPDEELFRKSISLEKIKLKKDDMLVIYTDGVTEAMNIRREQYGEERLLALIREQGHKPPEEFIAELDNDVKRFTDGYPQNDDITVVAVKEKLAADDVLFGIRKKLIDLVELDGLSVKDACERMKVSPATYYRYRKRLDVMGERGLKNDVLRKDVTLKRLSTEARKGLLEIITQNPDFGAKRLTEEYNGARAETHHVTERMVYEELKRLNLNTRELRIDYLKRNRLLREEDREALTGADARSMVDDLLRDLELKSEADEGTGSDRDAAAPTVGPAASFDSASDFELIDGVGLAVSVGVDGVAVVRVNGHLDSVTSNTLEAKLREVIAGGSTKIVVDLSDVTYISSGGWGIFTAHVRTLRQKEGDVILSGMTAEVYDVYELLGFADVLRAFTDISAARDHFALPIEDRVSTPIRDTHAARSAGAPEGQMGSDDPVVSEWESLRIEATTVGEAGEIAVLQLRGIIDTVSAERLREALARVIDRGLHSVVVDMSQVEYVSSGGWGTFTERLRDVRRAGGDIKLFGMDPDVYYVFTMLGFNIVLASFDILTEAIEDFRRPGGAVPSEFIPQPHRRPGVGGDARTSPDIVLGRDPATEEVDSPGAFAPGLLDRAEQDVVVWEDTESGTVVAHLQGPVEASAVGVLSGSLDRVLASRPARIVFDLARVTYISSTGWGQFSRALEEQQKGGAEVYLAALSPELYEIYRCLEFHAFLPAFDTLESALRAEAKAPAPPDVSKAPVTGSTGVLEAETPISGDESVAADVDAILGVDAGEGVQPSVAAPAPVRPDAPRWPGKPANPVVPAVPGVETALPEENPPRTHAPEDGPVARPGDPHVPDVAPTADDLEVDGTLEARHAERDRKIRQMGWAKYGEKLRDKSRGKDNDEDGDE